MGTTSTYGLPYPEGGDLVIGGDDAIQALAEAVEARMYASPIAYVALTDHGGALDDVDGAIVLTGAVSMSGFTFDGTTLTYTGGSCLFLVAAQVDISITDADPSKRSHASIVHNFNTSAPPVTSFDVTIYDAPGVARHCTHNLVVPLALEPGNTLQVHAWADPAGVLGDVGLRVYPIGPPAVM